MNNSSTNLHQFTALRGLTLLLVIVFIFSSASVKADVILVPTDYVSIQEAIDAAVNGDTVLVAPGTYVENINFTGKSITVISELGPEVTIIDGNQQDSVVTFTSGETVDSILSGFTIQNGRATFRAPYGGGGIQISYSSPTVTNNHVIKNIESSGSGIAISFASPVIQGNLISKNYRSSGSGGVGGGGVLIIGAGNAQILDNIISDNDMNSASGGGISMVGAGNPTIKNNVIRNNSTSGNGGGIWMGNRSDAVIVQNLIIDNTAAKGAGIYWLVPSGAMGPVPEISPQILL